MSSSAARRRSSVPSVTAHFPVAPPRPVPEPTARRGLTVVIEVPDDGPGSAELLVLAGTLHELALELVPGATTRTEVNLVPTLSRPDGGGR